MALANTEDAYKGIMCDSCGCYLSFSPVFVKDCGNSICGDCNKNVQQPTFRSKAYEALAVRTNFPCRFQSFGCEEKLVWEEAKHHEEICIFKKFNCFIGNCEWVGIKSRIKEHFEEVHPNNVLNSPCVLQPHINTKYLLCTMKNLFILQIKFSVITNIMSYHTCFLGPSKLASHFEYFLEIISEKGNLTMKKNVQSIEELYLCVEGSEINFNSNALLATNLISNYGECIFNFFVKLKNNVCFGTEYSCECEGCLKNKKQNIDTKDVYTETETDNFADCDCKQIPTNWISEVGMNAYSSLDIKAGHLQKRVFFSFGQIFFCCYFCSTNNDIFTCSVYSDLQDKGNFQCAIKFPNDLEVVLKNNYYTHCWSISLDIKNFLNLTNYNKFTSFCFRIYQIGDRSQ